MKPKTAPLSVFKNEAGESPPQTQVLTPHGYPLASDSLLPFYPHYFETALTQHQQHFYSQNGRLLLLKSLKLQVISQLETCYQLWQDFSPKESLFDTWEFRLAFWKGYRRDREPYFLVLKTDGDTLALLPLWYERDNKRYTWFGSTWQENNTFFVKDRIFIPLLLAVCPSPAILNALKTETLNDFKESAVFKVDDPKFTLDLTKINSLDDFLTSFNKKRRYNMKRDKRIIEAQQPQIIFDNFSDLKKLVALCKKRFYEKGEDTDWDDPRRVETFKQVISLGNQKGSYRIRMITVKIGKKTAAVDLILLFNGCYYPVKCGYNVAEFPGIGNYVNLLEIEDALRLGMRKMDFLEINYGWKDRWFETVPLYKFKKQAVI